MRKLLGVKDAVCSYGAEQMHCFWLITRETKREPGWISENGLLLLEKKNKKESPTLWRVDHQFIFIC